MQNILVIKHGALGDVILAQSPFQAIRQQHPDAKITLLTTKPFAGFLEKSGLFDDIWIDDKPKLWNFKRLATLRKKLRSGEFDRVYDLQTSQRTNTYFNLFAAGKKPEWCGYAKAGSHPHLSPMRTKIHTIERHVDQLGVIGVTDIPAADFSWAMTDISKFSLPSEIALLVPGGSAHRPEKRWPASRFGELACHLQNNGLTAVLLGGPAEADAIAEIRQLCPDAMDLSSQTSFGDIASLGAKAKLAIGNDTGPLHLISAVGCPTIVLFSKASNPDMSRPRGADVRVLREDNLADLPLQAVIDQLEITS
ncbi:glycosyltransferase family 9 protein [Sneathiella marina]|uniref:Glycosyltransferase family 9 protein n=1 Tax=Sneathiella marina TaxID=2950108 RepID=A0ABY4W982_9PROT|nr:glycosyltransferase family 9 protein [Sneathiella marina]USG62678.1 glycosyltransferase family 9 protein [Sneathiella marina]